MAGEAETHQIRVPWQPGESLGRYVLLTQIAMGGMAEIWLARQAGPKGFVKLVVIKKIVDSLAEEPEFVEMLVDEARIAAQLSHPNIVQTYDLGQHRGSYYIAMEYLHGETLSAVMRAAARAGQPLPIAYTVRLVASAAEALSYAHSLAGTNGLPLGIIHRDISPRNLLVTYSGILKVVDFGIAKAASRVVQTTGHQVKGTLGYLAPEQARGERVDHRSDIFSLGVVLFEGVTQTRLFKFDDQVALWQAVASREPLPSARERNPAVPERIEAILRVALARTPEERYLNARLFQVALEEWLHKEPQVPGTSDIASFMQTLFAERIAERSKLLDAASRDELTPVRLRESVLQLSNPSMPNVTIAATPAAMAREKSSGSFDVALEELPRQRRRRAITSAVAASLLALGLFAFLQMRSPEPAEPPPPPPRAALLIETEPPGAQVLVDQIPKGRAPLVEDNLLLGRHEVFARLEGHRDATLEVRLEQANERTRVVLTLTPLPKPESPADAGPQPKGPTETRGGSGGTKKGGALRPRTQAGRLTLDTVPWTRVFLGQELLGETPLVEVPLPAGRHLLRLVNEEQGIQRSVEVSVEPDKVTAKKFRF